jgi:hypothetical protein
MLFMRKTTALPSAAEALPGRASPMPTATTHFVNGRKLQPPYPAGLEQAVFGLGCFWGAERKFWELGDGIYATAVGYAGGHTPNPTYEEVCSGRTGHTEVVLVVFDPRKISYEQLLKTFWENHNPTQGMRQGNDVGEGSRRHHHRDRAIGRILFRRGLSSAISRQESGWLLRIGRHRRVVPDRRRRDRLTLCSLINLARLAWRGIGRLWRPSKEENAEARLRLCRIARCDPGEGVQIFRQSHAWREPLTPTL